jgi:hypothetical protein
LGLGFLQQAAMRLARKTISCSSRLIRAQTASSLRGKTVLLMGAIGVVVAGQ